MNKSADVCAIVPGGSNTDLIVSGAEPPRAGELAVGRQFRVGPGGKSRNVAQMMAALLGPGRVAFLGRTLSPAVFAGADRLLAAPPAERGDLLPLVYSLLAQVPTDALERAGVVTDHLVRTAYDGTAAGVAQIVVDPAGDNAIALAPGLNAEFSPDDVRAASGLFDAVGRCGGVLPLALEIPLATATAAAQMARERGLTVVLDPGGVAEGDELGDLLALADVVKPNEQETRILAGIEPTDASGAAEAARVLRQRYGIRRLIVTAGARGVWDARDGDVMHWPAYAAGEVIDTTGCGDQFMAALCCGPAEGRREPGPDDLRRAVVAAGLQAGKAGIQPVETDELDRHLPRFPSPGDG